MIDVKVFGCLPFTLSVLVLVFIQFICLGLGFLIPNYAQIVSGQGAFVAGCLLLPGCLLGAALSPISGRILDRFGAMKPILTGNVSILIALCCFSIFAGNLTTVPVVIFYLFFAFGQGFSVGNSMTNGLRQCRRRRTPTATRSSIPAAVGRSHRHIRGLHAGGFCPGRPAG